MQPAGAQAVSRLDQLGLDDVAAAARSCELCRLCRTRTHVVFGSGNPQADVMFVAEAPGYHEDRAGEAFLGAAGRLLDEMLASIGLERSDVYLTSVVKCRTPNIRTPFPDEVEQCEGYLFREVALVQPRVVCTLGNVAIRVFTGRLLRLSEVHGIPSSMQVRGRDVMVLPLYHPAAVLQVPVLMDTLRADVRTLGALLRGGGDAEPKVATMPASGASEPQPVIDAHGDGDGQLSMELG